MIVNADFIKNELNKVGVAINDIYDLVNTKESYPKAIPVLIDLLRKDIEPINIKEGIIRALAVKEAIGLASPILLEEYNKISKDKMMLRWAIGNTIYTTITEEDIERIKIIVRDKSNGISRQMFVLALGKVKAKEKVEDILIELLDDDEVCPHAIEALARLKSKKSKREVCEYFDNGHKSNISKTL